MTHLSASFNTPAQKDRLMSFSAKRPMATSADHGADHMSYLTRIKSFPVLTEAEERVLIRKWYERGDRAAYDALIGAHLRLVPKMAQRYAGYGIAASDLIGEGNLGLLQSAERFEPEKGFRFSTYARWWIKAAMLNFILQTWSLIKVGNGAAKKRLFFNLRRAKQQVQADGSRYLDDAAVDLLATRFQVSAADIVAMDQRMSANDVSLYQPIPGGEGLTFGDIVADPAPTPEDASIASDEQRQNAAVLKEALGHLERREKEIVTRRYLNERPATLAKLADAYGLTAERVRQIEAKAIGKLRHYMRPNVRRAAAHVM
jgi:RNA polymerase sigma-32 factor